MSQRQNERLQLRPTQSNEQLDATLLEQILMLRDLGNFLKNGYLP